MSVRGSSLLECPNMRSYSHLLYWLTVDLTSYGVYWCIFVTSERSLIDSRRSADIDTNLMPQGPGPEFLSDFYFTRPERIKQQFNLNESDSDGGWKTLHRSSSKTKPTRSLSADSFCRQPALRFHFEPRQLIYTRLDPRMLILFTLSKASRLTVAQH